MNKFSLVSKLKMFGLETYLCRGGYATYFDVASSALFTSIMFTKYIYYKGIFSPRHITDDLITAIKYMYISILYTGACAILALSVYDITKLIED